MADGPISGFPAASSTGPTDTMVLVQGGTTKKATMYLGSATNDSAAAGQIGETITSAVAGTSTGLTSNSPLNVASISLSAGDWDVWGSIVFSGVVSTSFTIWQGGLSTTTGTLPASNLQSYEQTAAIVLGGTQVISSFAVPPQRISASTTTTVFLVAQSTFTVSTAGAGGVITARRRR